MTSQLVLSLSVSAGTESIKYKLTFECVQRPTGTDRWQHFRFRVFAFWIVAVLTVVLVLVGIDVMQWRTWRAQTTFGTVWTTTSNTVGLKQAAKSKREREMNKEDEKSENNEISRVRTVLFELTRGSVAVYLARYVCYGWASDWSRCCHLPICQIAVNQKACPFNWLWTLTCSDCRRLPRCHRCFDVGANRSTVSDCPSPNCSDCPIVCFWWRHPSSSGIWASPVAVCLVYGCIRLADLSLIKSVKLFQFSETTYTFDSAWIAQGRITFVHSLHLHQSFASGRFLLNFRF